MRISRKNRKYHNGKFLGYDIEGKLYATLEEAEQAVDVENYIRKRRYTVVEYGLRQDRAGNKDYGTILIIDQDSKYGNISRVWQYLITTYGEPIAYYQGEGYERYRIVVENERFPTKKAYDDFKAVQKKYSRETHKKLKHITIENFTEYKEVVD